MDIEELKRSLNLKPLNPEGGCFNRIWYKPGDISVIYYLLLNNDFSEFHKLPHQEQYLFLMGDPVELFHGKPGSHILERTILGQKIKEGQNLGYLVESDCIQGSRLKKGGQWALLSTIMSPSYEQENYQPVSRSDLLKDFPAQEMLIQSLTRH